MKKKHYTAEEERMIREKYPRTPTKELALEIGVPAGSVYNKAASMGLRKDPAWLGLRRREDGRMLSRSEASRARRFRKGHATHNKGRKRVEYVTAAGIARMEGSQFKKGNVPANAKPVGYTAVRPDGYVRVRTAGRGRMPLLHHHVWEQANGPVPAGSVVAFRNGNTRDVRLENLELIGRDENMLRNTMHNYPPELVSAMMQLGRLKRKINRLKKERL